MPVITRRTTVPYDIQQKSGTILDILKQYAHTCAEEFCGKCMPCRYGTKEWTSIIQKLYEGQGTLEDINKMKTINHSMKTASFCRLGLVSPFVIDAILKYYQQELEDYITQQKPLNQDVVEIPKFTINTDLCNGCSDMEKSACKVVCTVNAIEGESGTAHTINQSKCFRCDDCTTVCPKQAIIFG